MRAFIYASDTELARLKQRATNCCLEFQDQEMPPGSTPPRARVGFQVGPRSNVVHLYVGRGQFAGDHPSVRQWLERGEKQFNIFEEMVRWFRQDLAAAFGDGPASPALEEEPRLPVEQLTDLDAVRRDLERPAQPLPLEKEKLFAELAREVRGQDAALHQLADGVVLHAAKRLPRRPASFFAIGPSGVGKTHSAETLARSLRVLDPQRRGYRYVRVDMSELKERHRVSQLLGAPPGYIGYGDRTPLLDTLAEQPRTVVLFDEVEKAHPDALQVLMNAMDAGRLSTPRGQPLDCRHALFLFTSNLEYESILEELEERDAFDEPALVDIVCRERLRVAGMLPEIVGRINSFLVFRPLSLDARAEILALAVVRTAGEYGLRVERVAPAVILTLLKQARGEGFGARPDEYLVSRVLGDCFARAAAAGMRSPLEVCGGAEMRCAPIAPQSAEGPEESLSPPGGGTSKRSGKPHEGDG